MNTAPAIIVEEVYIDEPWRASDPQEQSMLRETVEMMTQVTHHETLAVYETPKVTIVHVRAYEAEKDAKWSPAAHAIAAHCIETILADLTIEAVQVFDSCIAPVIKNGDVDEKKNAIVRALINLCHEYRDIDEASFLRLDGIKSDIIQLMH